MGDELKLSFRQLCLDYEDVIDEAAEQTPPLDERIGLALFKIDEATAAADMVRHEAGDSHAALVEALMSNCRELEDVFLRVDLIESFVSKTLATTKELEARLETINKAAEPVLNTSGVSSLLRSFSMKRPAAETTVEFKAKWEPLDINLNAEELLERLDQCSAMAHGVGSGANIVGQP